MNDKKYQLSETKLEELQTRLHFLKEKRLIKLLKAHEEAWEEGDFYECDAVYVARELIRQTESEILKIETILRESTTLVIDLKPKIVTLGSEVRIKIENNFKLVQLVDSPEADPTKNKISVQSPLGKAILNRKEGESGEFMVYGKISRVKIIKIL